MRDQLKLLKSRARRKGNAPSQQVARIGWLLLRLLHERAVEYAEYCDLFGRSLREFQRDLCKIRRIGKEHFSIEPIRKGRALLVLAPGRISLFTSQRPAVQATLARIAEALGGPLQHEMKPATGDAVPLQEDGFLHVREPLPAADAAVTCAFEFLKAASVDRARAEFAYQMRGARTVRRVEPYHVVFRSGRYYLVGYDLQRRDWRQFALDAIEPATLRRDGTFQHPRPVPERYLAQRAAGWITGSEPTDVTFAVTPLVCAAVCSRQWQKDQRVLSKTDRGAEITLTFADLGEAVRWALQFGPEVTVVAPPHAVAYARQTVERIAGAYEKRRQTVVARAM